MRVYANDLNKWYVLSVRRNRSSRGLVARFCSFLPSRSRSLRYLTRRSIACRWQGQPGRHG